MVNKPTHNVVGIRQVVVQPALATVQINGHAVFVAFTARGRYLQQTVIKPDRDLVQHGCVDIVTLKTATIKLEKQETATGLSSVKTSVSYQPGVEISLNLMVAHRTSYVKILTTVVLLTGLDLKDWEGKATLALAASKFQGHPKRHCGQLRGAPPQ